MAEETQVKAEETETKDETKVKAEETEAKAQGTESKADGESKSEDAESKACDGEAKSDNDEAKAEIKEESKPEGNGAEPEVVPESPRITGYKFQPVSKLLDDVLADAPPAEAEETASSTPAKKRRRYPLVLDLMLAGGLLVAVGGFTIGLFKMYVAHSAKQYILENNYVAAINILKKNQLPPFFNVDGNDPNELLDQALYADAMKRMSEENDLKGAISELEQIRPGSSYFDNAQQILSENFEPAPTTLTGGVSEERPTHQ